MRGVQVSLDTPFKKTQESQQEHGIIKRKTSAAGPQGNRSDFYRDCDFDAHIICVSNLFPYGMGKWLL